MQSTSGQANSFVGTYNYMSVSNLIANLIATAFPLSLATIMWPESEILRILMCDYFTA
jgi:hypothetical protein